MLASEKPRAGFYTGTFDPPTRSHIQIMSDAVRTKGLAKLVVVVNQSGSAKSYRCTAEQRAELIRAGLPTDVAARIEVRVEPEIGKNALFSKLAHRAAYDWIGVIGHDSFETLNGPVRLSRHWLVIDRDGKSAAAADNVDHMSIGPLGQGVSSGLVRSRLAEGKDVSALLCRGTARLIDRRGYYITPTDAVIKARHEHFDALVAGMRAALAPPFIAQQAPEEQANYIRRYLNGLLKQP